MKHQGLAYAQTCLALCGHRLTCRIATEARFLRQWQCSMLGRQLLQGVVVI